MYPRVLSVVPRRKARRLSPRLLGALVLLGSVLGGAGVTPAATRLGLHTTAEELAIWRTRAISGPYKSFGDVSTNSPGDWDRIAFKAEYYRVNSADFFQATGGSGCISQGSGSPPFDDGRRVKDAAFFALIKLDTDIKNKVRDWLLAQMNEPTLDFANRARWCIQTGASEQPISEWLPAILHAMDYIEILDPAVFTTGQRTALRNWFLAWAEMANENLKLDLAPLFVNRLAGDYTPTQGPFWYPAIPYMEANGTPGPEISQYAQYYNNRRGSSVGALAEIAVKFDVAAYKTEAVRLAKEYIMFAVFPQQFLSDFERAVTDDDADRGWSYASASFWSNALGVADVLARAGDRSVYDFVTSAGVYGSEGGSKSVFFATMFMFQYMSHNIDRYGTDNAANAGNPDFRIDGRMPSPPGQQTQKELNLVPANVFFKNAYIKSAYMRTAPGTIAYATDGHNNDGDVDWQGKAGIFPGVLFMFGQMEDLVDPYNLGAAPSVRRRPPVQY